MRAKYMAAMKWILEHCNKTMKQIILSFWTTWQCRCPLERLEFPHIPTASKQLNHCILDQRWTLPMTCCGDWIRKDQDHFSACGECPWVFPTQLSVYAVYSVYSDSTASSLVRPLRNKIAPKEIWILWGSTVLMLDHHPIPWYPKSC